MGLFGKIAGAFREEPPRAPLRRNELCWCGSGKKYKQCHIDRDRERVQARQKSCCTTS